MSQTNAEDTPIWPLVKELPEKLSSISPRKIVLFGSYARGDFNIDSDIDIFVEVGKRDAYARDVINRVGASIWETTGLLLSILCISSDEYNKHFDEQTFQSIRNEGILIWQQ